ncbi:MAG: hypothetical protein HS111_02995 [Kofleriaceae bacterium]|nr:hypothetical protein [Kofleriaceae bacterium]MCL4222852.1 hypothetical protein [Myxococcales bacterium]
MVTVDNSYEEVAEHCRVGHKRDVLFGIVIALVALFAAGSMRSASQTLVDATPPPTTCKILPTC